MASGIGVTYELEFVIKDKNAKKWIENMAKEAERLAKTLDKVSLNGFNKQLQHMQKHMQTQGNQLKQQMKMAQDMMKTLGSGKNLKTGLDDVKRNAQQAKTVVEQLNKVKNEVGKEVKNPFPKVNKGAQDALKNAKKLLGKVRDGALYRVGSFIANAGAEALQEYGQTDYELRGASAKTGGMYADLKEYRKLTKEVGGATKFNNLDVAQAINAGATLGIKAEEMKAIIPASANLAQAFNSDIPRALEMTKMHMNAYGLTSKDAIKVTDMIAVTSQNSAADLERLGEGFKYVAPTAKALGVDIATTYAMLGKLNDNGLLGSTAGTGMNQMFESLKDFSKRDKLEQLIGKVTDEKGNLNDITDIMTRLKTVTDKMGNADKQGVLKAIFGVQGGRAMNTFLNTSIEDLKKFREEIKNSSGAAKRLSDFMMSGSAGAIETLMGTLSSTFASIFDSLAPLIVPVAGALMLVAEGIVKITEKAPWLVQFVSVLGSLVVGIAIFSMLKTKIMLFTTAMKTAIVNIGLMNSLLLVGLALALVVVFRLFQKWQEYLSQNQQANKAWGESLNLLGYALSALGDLVFSFLGALIGVNLAQEEVADTTKFMGLTAEQVAERLKSFKKIIFEITLKIQEMRRWVEQNGETIRFWAKAFMMLLPVIGIIKVLTAVMTIFNAVVAMNPIVFIITAIIVAIGFLVAIIMYLWNTNEKFRNFVIAAWNFIKDNIALVIGILTGGPFGILIGGLINLYLKNEEFRNGVKSTWEAIKSTFKSAIDSIVGFFGPLISKIGEAWNGLKKLASGAGNVSIGKTVSNAMSGALNYRTSFGMQTHATGTDNFMAGRSKGWTTVDEHGDEAIWLPNGSMVARNTTTRDIANNLQAIKNNTRGNNSSGTVVTNHNSFTIIVQGAKEAGEEIIRELENLGIV